jgi:hypothetical protein
MRGLPYLLACFAAKADMPEEARAWLAESAAMGGPSEITNRTLEAGDLALSDPAPTLNRPALHAPPRLPTHQEKP